MKLCNITYNFSKFQHMKNNFAKYTFCYVFVIITQWLGLYIVFHKLGVQFSIILTKINIYIFQLHLLWIILCQTLIVVTIAHLIVHSPNVNFFYALILQIVVLLGKYIRCTFWIHVATLHCWVNFLFKTLFITIFDLNFYNVFLLNNIDLYGFTFTCPLLNTYTYTHMDVDGPCTLPWNASPKPHPHTTVKTTSMNEKNIIHI
jgi:hypothetical protein